MLAPIARISQQYGRSLLRNNIRNSSNGGIPGENFPLNLKNRYRMTMVYFLFIGSGLWLPFFIIRHQLKKN